MLIYSSVPVVLSQSKKTLAEEAGLPLKPKKPLTPYFRFLKEVRPQVVAKNPKALMPELMRLVGKQWETVDESVKQKYQEEWLMEKEIYEKENSKYQSKLTPSQMEDLKAARQERVDSRERRLHKKKNRELNKPKKAATAFFRYMKDEKARNPPPQTERHTEFVRKVSEKWNKLSDKEKKPYVDAFEKDNTAYKKELEKWEAQMIKEGHYDVVRKPLFVESAGKKSPSRKQEE